MQCFVNVICGMLQAQHFSIKFSLFQFRFLFLPINILFKALYNMFTSHSRFFSLFFKLKLMCLDATQSSVSTMLWTDTLVFPNISRVSIWKSCQQATANENRTIVSNGLPGSIFTYFLFFVLMTAIFCLSH